MNGSPYNFPSIAAAPDPDRLDPIAIVGMSCRLPGAADVDAFRALLWSGTDAVTEIPDWRWNKAHYFHPDRGQRGKAYTFAAGVLEDVAGFDAAFFGISPREAVQVDPQQRLALELAHEAIEDAGIDGARLAGSPVGVFVGGSSWDYLNRHVGDPSTVDAYSMTGVTLCSLSNRISYAFDLRGPSFTVDTACSSSLVALHQACEALRGGTIPAALVGGISLLLAPQSYIGFCAASMLSPRGRCHAFDARADGYVRAEGGGFVMLKRLREALADGDRIRAVIRGTGVNSDGRTTGFSLPNRQAQAALLHAVYDRFGLDPARLAYVEAHGTGTPAGDPIEAGALGEVLGLRREGRLPIGSVKANIGHLEAASGMAGLIKSVLAIEQGTIPPSLHCSTPNPAIPFDRLNLEVASRERPMAGAAETRLVGINSFGFGGTNAHAVLGTAPAPIDRIALDAGTLPPLLLSARSEEALRVLAARWRVALQEHGGDLPAMLRGAAYHREQHGRRLVATGEDRATLIAGLDAFLAGRDARRIAHGQATAGRIGFVFSGNGSQWAGMAADAMQGSPSFAAALAQVDEALVPWLGWSVIQKLAAPDAAALRRTEIAQPLLFAVQAALVLALREHGVEADACMGHSVGEIAAAWAAGALDLDSAARVIAARSGAQQARHGIGAMGVLGIGAQAAAELLAEPMFAGTIEIAACNGAEATTLAGSSDALATLAEEAAARGLRFSRLDLDYAFHSAAMDPIRDGLAASLHGLASEGSRLSFYSTVTGAIDDGEALDGEYWWRNVRAPVRFADAARAMVADGVRIFFEIGPHAVLQAYLGEALRAADVAGKVLPTLGRRPIEGDPIGLIAARAHAAGADIRQASAFGGTAALAGLPSYPWQRDRFWLDQTEEASDPGFFATEHPLLGERRGEGPFEWASQLSIETLPWLGDHIVGGAAVMPAAALIEMALAAGRARHPAAPIELRDLEINRALVFEPGVIREVRLRVANSEGDFEIASRPRLIDAGWTVHAKGRIGDGRDGGAIVALPVPVASAHRMDGAALYGLAASIGLDYGTSFRTVQAVMTADAIADVALIERLGVAGDYLLAPNLVDGAFQALVALAAGSVGGGTSVLPWRFGRIRLLRADGGRPASARLRIVQQGPRSVRADLLLADAGGETIAELRDCWFVRTTLDQRARAEQPFFRTIWEGAPGGDDEARPPRDLAALLGEEAAAAPEAQLLADAYAAAAALAALRTIVPAGVAALVSADLIRSGAISPEARGRLDELLGWLVTDEHATPDDDGGVRLGASDGIAPERILRTILFDAPRAVADTALLAAGAAALADGLRTPAADAVPPALWEQFLHDSPAGMMAAQRLMAAVARAVADQPQAGALRVLEIGAGRGRFTRRLLHILPDGARVTAATSDDDLAGLRDELAGDPRAHAAAWPQVAAGDGRFDLVVGLYGLTLGPADLGAMGKLLVPGGLLIAVEPLPNRTWALARPAAGKVRDIAAWEAEAAAAGFARTASTILPTEIWPAALVAAQAPGPAVARRPSAPRMALIAPLDEALAAALATELAATGGLATLLAPGAMPEAGQTAVWPVPSDLPLAELLQHVTRHARDATRAGPAKLTLLVRATADGDAPAAALTGLVRVLANEVPDLACRLIRLDPALPLAAAAARAAGEIVSPDAEGEVAWTASARRVPRFAQHLPPLAPVGDVPLRLEVARPGLLDSLGWQATTPAQPGAGEIAIDIHAAGLNFRDVMWAMGLLPDEALLEGFAGAALGLECAGLVRAIGPDVTDFAIGDRVMAFAPRSLGTRTVTAAHAVMRMPADMDFAAAATIPVAFLTVAYALGHLARIEAGERILIHGGAGGVGLAAIQYAQARGAIIYATAGSPAKRALLASLGVEAVLDSRSLTFADEVMRLTDGAGVDVVLNSLSGAAMERSLSLLRPFGRFLELGKRDFYENSAIRLRPFRHNITYYAIDADQLPLKRPALAAAIFAEITALFASGALRPLPHRMFDYADAQAAFRLMQSAGHIGKIVLAPGDTVPLAHAAPPPFAARADRTFVVTGGLQGFGLETARWLVAHGARSLALVGRRGGATPDADALLATFAGAGVDARAYACDVTDAEAVAAMLDEVRATQAPIGGIVHAAVMMDDALVAQLDEARFAQALAVKLGGAEALDRLTRSDPVELFLLFSSVTTMFGNPGQASYVAANAAIEAVAERRQAERLPALAVQWGPIGDAGYLARESDISSLLERQLGGHHLTAHEALDALPALLAAGVPVAGYATLRWAALRGSLPLLATPLFADLESKPGEQGGDLDLRTLLADLSPEDKRDRVVALLAEEVARIMKLAPDRIEPHRPLPELGMDSLMAVELRLAVEERFGVAIPVLALSDSATLAAMAARIVASLGGAGAVTPDADDEVVAQLARFEDGAGPADGAPAPAEPGFAAAAAATP